ncbi:hypothetical protein K7X08_035542 [Anisodus acutangulus]|uniref:SET domain-containing protein n=1 Tax=Anisodus acutangulus TaxID=402998 RepID=A0A9Q1LJA8_9SOLA|nr:hypothetical protein K7X08_035542 [Anisodus acutangulus]
MREWKIRSLKGGKLALNNSMDLGYPMRVICGRQRVNGEKSDIRYIYDGLYTVKLTRELVSRQANLGKVNHFRKNLNKATKSVMQVVHSEFVVDYDLSQGKEKIPIPAVNAIDDERPPPFTYITSMQYPDWYHISRVAVAQVGARILANALVLLGMERKDEDGFTLDAVRYGNVGRFINHSCSPNLYAQNVMYDHDDRRVPHIMFLTAERIAPLEELTYHYNYQIGHVRDRNGNLKIKNCRCGSHKCEGRMY